MAGQHPYQYQYSGGSAQYIQASIVPNPRANFQVQIPRLPQTFSDYGQLCHSEDAGNVPSRVLGPQIQRNHVAVPGPTTVYPQQAQYAQSTPKAPTPQRVVTRPESASQKPAKGSGYEFLLLSLAEEYISAANAKNEALQNLLDEPQHRAEYFQLIASALACLEAVLKKFRLDAVTEANTRLRYASLLLQETENYYDAEEILNKGIALCDQHRLFDLKYNMQHLLIRVMFHNNSRAPLKFLDQIIENVTLLNHTVWIYAFRFLRITLSLKAKGSWESIISHLRTTAEIADRNGDFAVGAAAYSTEALLHLRRSSSAESIEQAQHAIAAARKSQLDPIVGHSPQTTALLHFAEVSCCVHLSDVKGAPASIRKMQAYLDDHIDKPQWSENGVFQIPISPLSATRMSGSGSAGGVVVNNGKGEVALALQWIPKLEIYALGYLLSAVVSAPRNATDARQKCERYLQEASNLLSRNPRHRESLSIFAQQHSMHQELACQVRLELVYALCVRLSWKAASRTLAELEEAMAKLPTPLPNITCAVTYLHGVIVQAKGDLDTALRYYQSPVLALRSTPLPPNSAAEPHLTLSILAALSTICITSDPKHPSHHLFSTSRAQLAPYFPPSTTSSGQQSTDSKTHHNHHHFSPSHPQPIKSLLGTYSFVTAATAPDTTEILPFKFGMNRALNIAKEQNNQQLMSLTLSYIHARFFKGVIADQAMKSAQGCLQLAEKIGDGLWMSVDGGVLAETLELFGKREEAGDARAKAVERAEALEGGLWKVCE
ncbi:hypothetical protein MMC25_005285 [Agyrium rufum]|nr:hypothetical protein [Agyrium rufum]